jgi:DNA-binding phage protein
MTIKKEKKSKTLISYRDGLLNDLKDPGEAAAYLKAALEDGSQEVFMLRCAMWLMRREFQI